MSASPESQLRYKVLIVDVDDTLSLTEEGCFYLENEALRRIGSKPMSREIHRKTWGKPLFDVISTRSPGVALEAFKIVMPQVHKQFIAEGRVDVVTPENLAAIDKVRRLGLQVMTLTNRTLVEYEHLLDPNHALASRIDAHYHWDNIEFHKPDPRAFAHIEAEHGFKPEECLYIGDSPSDAAASTGAGIDFIACMEAGLRSLNDFAPYPLIATVDRFADIGDTVEQLLKAA